MSIIDFMRDNICEASLKIINCTPRFISKFGGAVYI